MAAAKTEQKNPIQVVARMIKLLDVLAGHPEPLGLKQVAQYTGLHPSTAHRILSAMAADRIVDRIEPGSYRLGMRLLELGNLVKSRINVREMALPVMRELHAQTGFQDVGMNSFNHYSYGAIGEWMYRVVAGIEADADVPGYRHTLIQPQPGGGLTNVRATLNSPYGEVASAWHLTDDVLHLRVSVPPNAAATVYLPADTLAQVTESGKAVRKAEGVSSAKAKGGVVTIEIGSGDYDFTTAGLTLAQAMAGVRHIAGRLDRTTPLSELKANDKAQAALAAHIGDALERIPRPPWMGDASLEQLSRMAPDLLSEERLKAIEHAIN